MSHKRAYDLFLKESGLNARERTEKEQLLLEGASQQGIVSGLNIMNQKDYEQTKKKFETAYFLAKNRVRNNCFKTIR